ncbi:TRAP transporter small permease [Nocardioides seonyuensis]|uniref:TRAP transporter small permease n=1 Tax=Nocardioides seonyuensis TaxID=2518371 RepID=A0A4P7IFA2_9ACTN|nr:TRAP transporter small permease [Nocardioides seonyuensis]QBX55945.1 TRAP transporter small permease [Nocardioides seonyuensis]
MSLVRITTVVDRMTYELARAIGVVAMLGFIVHISVDVFVRATAGQSWRSTLDFTAFWYMPLLVFAGFAVAEHAREHMEVNILTARLTRGAQDALEPLALICMTTFAALVAWYGLEGAREDMELGKAGVISDLPLWPLRFMVPVGAGLLIVQVLCSHVLRRASDHG